MCRLTSSKVIINSKLLKTINVISSKIIKPQKKKLSHHFISCEKFHDCCTIILEVKSNEMKTVFIKTWCVIKLLISIQFFRNFYPPLKKLL